jgi:hypothetical protein
MALWDEVKQVCKALHQDKGWRELLNQAGIVLSETDTPDFADPVQERELKDRLSASLSSINRQVSGFEDFHPEGVRAIEPGEPAKSLLYHALASPRVKPPKESDTSRLRYWIETIENYVYGVKPPTLEALSKIADGNPMAIVVFAYDYRPAYMTPHGQFADLCFSRTGVARVGTTDAVYNSEVRAFLPHNPVYPDRIPVMPARYGAFIAMQGKGSAAFLGNYMNRLQGDSVSNRPDEERDFWVPLHKLFPGSECLPDVGRITLEFKTYHVNEKLSRIHRALNELGFPTGQAEEALSQSPFLIEEGLADLKAFSCSEADISISAPATSELEASSVFLIPKWKDRLVEPAIYKTQGEEKLLPLQVPENYITEETMEDRMLFSSLRIPEKHVNGFGEFRSAPEYINVRHPMSSEYSTARHGSPGELQGMNVFADVVQRIITGGYHAQHYIDHTGEGWVTVSCPMLTEQSEVTTKRMEATRAAYSIIAPPDFLPHVSQRQVYDWWQQTEDIKPFQPNIWFQPPVALADHRFAPNLTLSRSGFHPNDTTTTAVITPSKGLATAAAPLSGEDPPRVSFLPDGAAGIFAPGWDIGLDISDPPENVVFLASYGGGSPFLEDSLSCAALSSYWPAAAPDTARVFPPLILKDAPPMTVVPLTDKEIGRDGGVAWDGLPAPDYPVQQDGKCWVRYISIDNADYVSSALARKFNVTQLVQVTLNEYTRRILAMQQVYSALGLNIFAQEVLDRRKLNEDKARRSVLSFRAADERDTADIAAIKKRRPDIPFPARIDRWEVYTPGENRPAPEDGFRLVEILSFTILYTMEGHTFFREDGKANWQYKAGLVAPST